MDQNDSIRSSTSKIDELTRQAWNARISDSPKAFELSQEALKLAKETGYTKGIAEALRSLGFCYVRLSKNTEALPLLKESLSLFTLLGDQAGQAVIYEYIGIVERNWGNLGASLESMLKGHEIIRHMNEPEIEVTSLYQAGVTYKHLGNYEKALEYLYQCLSLARETGHALMEAYALNVIGSIYFENGDYSHALDYYRRGLVMRQESGDKWGEAGSLDNVGFTLLKLKEYEQATHFCKQSLEISRGTGDKKSQANALLHLAEVYKQANDLQQAAQFSNDSLAIRKESGDRKGEAEALLFLADLYSSGTDTDQQQLVPEYATRALTIAEEIKTPDLISKAHYQLYQFFKFSGRQVEAIASLETHMQLEKELHKNAIDQKILNLEISHKAEKEKKEAELVRLRNEELTRLNAEIVEQKKKLEDAIADLKATQAQLIQAEKMASLGELTAGIAHEIQNPLNFINNFADINTELIEELNEELKKENYSGVSRIVKDIQDNETKINHHGQRADNIVKSMLQHSRTSSGQKEIVDINTLADEYLRLAYHGLRAKKKGFNVKIETDFDRSIDSIFIIPQDIGRVLLNLINNAFYTVNEKQKLVKENYEPVVSITTKRTNGKIEITVTDNGNGIDSKIVDKIFQPFFTTKPTGQGTGLGLSLSYDIVKAHGGEIKVETKEGEGTAFIIQFANSQLAI